MPLKKILYPLAKHWIAGDKLSDAIKVAKKLNSYKIKAMINFIGEDVTNSREAGKIFSEYVKIIKAIKSNKIKADISIKPTQFCIHPESNYCYNILSEILNKAKRNKIFVWFDMESSKFTDYTIKLYLNFFKSHPHTGIALQATLKRTGKDLGKIIRRNGIVRLVKGAYKENSKIAFTEKKEIDKNYIRLMKVLFRKSKRFAIATHDDKMINAAVDLNKKYKRDVEFQILHGIREDLIEKMVSDGKKASVYLTYGTEWLQYGLRRIRERKKNILLLFKSLF
jgi:proline dehydrogenase